jgi:hypothetical protein
VCDLRSTVFAVAFAGKNPRTEYARVELCEKLFPQGLCSKQGFPNFSQA